MIAEVFFVGFVIQKEKNQGCLFPFQIATTTKKMLWLFCCCCYSDIEIKGHPGLFFCFDLKQKKSTDIWCLVFGFLSPGDPMKRTLEIKMLNHTKL